MHEAITSAALVRAACASMQGKIWRRLGDHIVDVTLAGRSSSPDGRTPGSSFPRAAAHPAGVWFHHLRGGRPAFLPAGPAATLTMTIAASPGLSTPRHRQRSAGIAGMNHRSHLACLVPRAGRDGRRHVHRERRPAPPGGREPPPCAAGSLLTDSRPAAAMPSATRRYRGASWARTAAAAARPRPVPRLS